MADYSAEEVAGLAHATIAFAALRPEFMLR
jgi:hypothetical protein